MTNLFRIALAQFSPPSSDPMINCLLAEQICRQAKTRGASLVLFPEMWSDGYAHPETPSPDGLLAWQEHAIPEKSAYLDFMCRLARSLKIGIVATAMVESCPSPQNVAYLISPDGAVLLKYAKVHTCAFDVEKCLTPGDSFPVCSFPLPEGGHVMLGIMICFDREFPESARLLMLGGAEIVLVPNASPMDPMRLQQLSVRSFENMIGTAMANYPGIGRGRSAAFSPVVYDKEGRWVDNTLLVAGEDEELPVVTFDLSSIRDYRSRECWGNAYRKPETYGALLDRHVKHPFVRNE